MTTTARGRVPGPCNDHRHWQKSGPRRRRPASRLDDTQGFGKVDLSVTSGGVARDSGGG